VRKEQIPVRPIIEGKLEWERDKFRAKTKALCSFPSLFCIKSTDIVTDSVGLDLFTYAGPDTLVLI
jgi:hypothetical protein